MGVHRHHLQFSLFSSSPAVVSSSFSAAFQFVCCHQIQSFSCFPVGLLQSVPAFQFVYCRQVQPFTVFQFVCCSQFQLFCCFPVRLLLSVPAFQLLFSQSAVVRSSLLAVFQFVCCSQFYLFSCFPVRLLSSVPACDFLLKYILTKYVNLLSDYFHAIFIVYNHFQPLDHETFGFTLNDLSITRQINKHVNFQWWKIIFYSTLLLRH